MDDIKKGLGCYITFIIIVMIIGGAIKFVIDFPIAGCIIGIVVLTIVGYLIYRIYHSTGDSYLEWKFGKDFQKAMDSGQLSLTNEYPCKPNGEYTSKRGIDKECGIELPNFVVKECRETLADFTGDYFGGADIEFECPIDENIIMQIEDDMRQNQSKWKNGEGDHEYICYLLEPDLSTTQHSFWRILIKKGSTLGKIFYGRI